jgi:site-specific recombinase XerD
MTPSHARTGHANFPVLLERYFTEYLLNQRNVSRETIASYRDTFRLFLRFSEQRFHKPPASMALADLDAPRVLAFLDDLERTRHNTVRTRNTRLAAIRAFLRYAALQDPSALAPIQRTLAIPVKRFDRKPVAYLARDEVTAILAAPNGATWSGHRDGDVPVAVEI